jgi:hypothetical protein
MFGNKIVNNPLSKCGKCLVKTMCENMCYEQGEIMLDNPKEFFESIIRKMLSERVVTKGRDDVIQLIINSENTYLYISQKGNKNG